MIPTNLRRISPWFVPTSSLSGPWFVPTTSLSFSALPFCPSFEDPVVVRHFFFENSRPIPVNHQCLLHPHFRSHVYLNVCSLGWVIESNTLRSVTGVSSSFSEPDDRWEGPSHRSGSSRWRGSPVPFLDGEVTIRFGPVAD